MRPVAFVMLACVAITPNAGAEETSRIPIQNAIAKLIREVDVPSEVAGVLSEVMVHEGDRVKAGQVVARIRDQKVRMEVKRAQIEQSTAKAQADNDLAIKDAELAAAVAENELARVLSANQRNPNTYRIPEVERYQLLANRSKLQVQQSRHERNVRLLDQLLAENRLEVAVSTLSDYEVKAPWDGVVISVKANPGKWLEPGGEIIRMIDPKHLRVEGFVSSEFAVEDLVGASAEIEYGRPGTEPTQVTGKVVFVSPDINPVNSLARIFVEVDSPSGSLRPGWTVTAHVRVASEDLADSADRSRASDGIP